MREHRLLYCTARSKNIMTAISRIEVALQKDGANIDSADYKEGMTKFISMVCNGKASSILFPMEPTKTVPFIINADERLPGREIKCEVGTRFKDWDYQFGVFRVEGVPQMLKYKVSEAYAVPDLDEAKAIVAELRTLSDFGTDPIPEDYWDRLKDHDPGDDLAEVNVIYITKTKIGLYHDENGYCSLRIDEDVESMVERNGPVIVVFYDCNYEESNLAGNDLKQRGPEYQILATYYARDDQP